MTDQRERKRHTAPSRAVFIPLAVLAAFLLLVSGFYLGRKTVRGVTVSAERPLAAERSAEDVSVQAADDGKININTATAEDLQALPMIGQTLAERIIRYREQHGAFVGISELMDVEGIGQTRFDAIKDHVTVG